MTDVSCAIIIDENGAVLVTQRSDTMALPLKWEFPGGKVELGESPEACLLREIKEELDITIEIEDALPSNMHTYGSKSIRLIPFICKISNGVIHLKEHAACLWLKPGELSELDWAEADVPVLREFLKRHK